MPSLSFTPFRRALAGFGALALVVTAGSVLVPASAQTAAPVENLVAYTIIIDTSQIGEAQVEPTGCQLATIDPTTGVVTALGAAPDFDACVIDLAVAPDGVVWGFGAASQFNGSIDTEQAVIEDVQLIAFAADGSIDAIIPLTYDGTQPVSSAVGGLSVSADGVVHIMAVNSGLNELFTVDIATGVTTAVAEDGAEAFQTGLTDCSSTLLTVNPLTMNGEPAPSQAIGNWVIIDEITGSWTLGPENVTTGYDCVSNETTLFAIAPQLLRQESVDPANGVLPYSFGTVDPTDGEFTEIAPITYPENFGPIVEEFTALGVHRVTPAPVPPAFTG